MAIVGEASTIANPRRKKVGVRKGGRLPRGVHSLVPGRVAVDKRDGQVSRSSSPTHSVCHGEGSLETSPSLTPVSPSPVRAGTSGKERSVRTHRATLTTAILTKLSESHGVLCKRSGWKRRVFERAVPEVGIHCARHMGCYPGRDPRSETAVPQTTRTRAESVPYRRQAAVNMVSWACNSEGGGMSLWPKQSDTPAVYLLVQLLFVRLSQRPQLSKP